jgi:transposase-like protein
MRIIGGRMTRKSLPEAAEALLAEQLSPREPGEKLRAADEARILDLSAQGVTQMEIAREIGCHQSTVSRTIADWTDTRGLARKLAEAKALDMTRRFVNEASPPELLKMLAKLDVVREDREAHQKNGVVINIGMPGAPLEPPVMPPL